MVTRERERTNLVVMEHLSYLSTMNRLLCGQNTHTLYVHTVNTTVTMTPKHGKTRPGPAAHCHGSNSITCEKT